MQLLTAKLYDPGTADSKSTAVLQVMTAMDTTNLRLSFNVPPHGNVFVRLRGVVHGSTSMPTILLGVMNGGTVVGRVAPHVLFIGSATAQLPVEAKFVVSGLSPGPVTWDAAYGVEVTVASTAIKYGGLDDVTSNNAFGGFSFEVWDPAPITESSRPTGRP